MNNIVDFIQEKLRIDKNIQDQYNYQPKDRYELSKLIGELIEERGNNANLNDIDTSKITDMHDLFYDTKFNGDISEWNVSNVENMRTMFAYSRFNGDISKWNVSKVKNMRSLFYMSDFDGDVSNWDISKVKDMDWMFEGCPLEKHKPKWYHE